MKQPRCSCVNSWIKEGGPCIYSGIFSAFNMCKVLGDVYSMDLKWSKSVCLTQVFCLNWSSVVESSCMIDPCRKETLILNLVNSNLVCISIKENDLSEWLPFPTETNMVYHHKQYIPRYIYIFMWHTHQHT